MAHGATVDGYVRELLARDLTLPHGPGEEHDLQAVGAAGAAGYL